MPFDLGLDEAHHRIGGDGRVDRVAAALEHLHPRLRGQRLVRGDNAVFRGDFRPADDHTHMR